MYSSGVSSYQAHMRNAFEELFLEGGVDAYISGHIHWYERMYPLGTNGTIDTASIVNNNTYRLVPLLRLIPERFLIITPRDVQCQQRQVHDPYR